MCAAFILPTENLLSLGWAVQEDLVRAARRAVAWRSCGVLRIPGARRAYLTQKSQMLRLNLQSMSALIHEWVLSRLR